MFRKIENRKAAALGGDKQEEYQSFLIKRKLVSVEIEVNSKGQYETFSQKLPFNAARVVGVNACSSVSDLNESPVLGRCYFGISPGRQYTEDFIKSLDSMLILSERTILQIQPNEKEHHEDEDDEDDDHDHGSWTYYAQPKRLGDPIIKMGGKAVESRNPATISVLDDATGIHEDYYIWKSQEDNHREVEIEIIQQQPQP
jgi:hypothetical protein